MKKPPKPWERQEGEPAAGYRLYTLYRDMQGRSIGKLTKLMGRKSTRAMEKQSSKWEWVRRAEAWDAELDLQLRQRESTEIEGMHRRHIQLALGAQTAVGKELRALVNKVEHAAKDADAAGKSFHDPVLSVNELIRLADHGINLERLTRGEPGVIAQTKGQVDLSGLSVEELRMLKKLRAKASGE